MEPEERAPFPEEFAAELRGRHSFESRSGKLDVFDELGRPLNPRGRTGLAMRGVRGQRGAHPLIAS